MRYNNYTYVILDISELSNMDFSKLLTNSADTVRKNLDNSKFVVKFKGEAPSFLNGKTLLTHEQILEELNKTTWREEEEDIMPEELK